MSLCAQEAVVQPFDHTHSHVSLTVHAVSFSLAAVPASHWPMVSQQSPLTGFTGHTSGIIHHASAHQFVQKQSQVSSWPHTVSFGFQELPETHCWNVVPQTPSTGITGHTSGTEQ